MSWHGYIPQDVWDKFKEDDPVISEELKIYGMMIKHGGEHALPVLFEIIKGLKIQISKLAIELKDMEKYTQNLEEIILINHRSRDGK